MQTYITPDKIKKIVKIPKVAWPTVILCLICVFLEVAVLYLLTHNLISKYLAALANTIIIFAVFTPMHDAAHGSVASSEFGWLNFLIGYLSAACFPIPFPAFKRLHLLHHKHTNEADDPDVYAGSGPIFLLPLRWMTIEIKYYVQYLSSIHTRPRLEASAAIISLVLIASAFYSVYFYGQGEVLFWGMLLPGRAAIALLAYFFDYLPHRPHKVTRQEDQFAATSVTSLIGTSTWWLTWPLLHQNYHNVHHLAPYIPFYEYSTVWHACKSDLISRGTLITPIFGYASKDIK